MVNEKIDLLAIGVHPDDVELSCSGTILKHIDLGYKVAILDLTQGELGSRGNAKIRLEEASKAAKLMGVSKRSTLNMKDGFFQYSEENIKLIVEQIRRFQPEIVLANAVNDRHPDHGRASKLIADACFISGLVKVETVYAGQIQKGWRPKTLFHYIQDYNLEPDFVIDISEYIDRKMEAILCYKSQFYDPDSNEQETPISGKSFLDFIKAKSKTYGRSIGVSHAEGFTKTKILGVRNLFDID